MGIGLIARVSGPSRYRARNGSNDQGFFFEATMPRAEIPCERAGKGFLGLLSERGQPCRSGAGQRGDCDGLGRRPLGWYCGHGPSARTPRLLAEEGGFLCHSDAYNDDTSCFVRVGDRRHLVIPSAADVSDTRLWRASGLTGGGQFFAYVRNLFDALSCQRRVPYPDDADWPASADHGPARTHFGLTALYRIQTAIFRCLVRDQGEYRACLDRTVRTGVKFSNLWR